MSTAAAKSTFAPDRPAAIRPLLYFAPNAPAAWAVVAAAATELGLLALSDQSIHQFGWSYVLGLTLLLVWMWLTACWLGWFSARILQRASRHWRKPLRRAAWSVAMTLSAAAAAAYVGSWASYLRTGAFIGVGDIHRAPGGLSGLLATRWRGATWPMLAQFAAAVAVVLVVGWLAGRPIIRSRWRSPLGDTRRLAMSRVVVWATLFIAPLGAQQLSQSALEASVLRARREVTLKGLNPVATLAISWIHEVAAEPIRPVIDEQELVPLANPGQTPRGGPERPSIIFFVIDSLRGDVVGKVHQQREIMPRLNELARRGVVFSRAYTTSTHADYADPAIISSLYPLRDRKQHVYRADDPWPRACIYDVLKPAGYATAIISSRDDRWRHLDRFCASPNLDLFYDGRRSGTVLELGHLGALEGVEDLQTMDVALRWIGAQPADHPYYLGVHLRSSSFPYDLPPGAARVFEPSSMDFEASFTAYPQDKADEVRNAYYNALHHCDAQLGRLVDALRETGRLDETILVVMGNHGEAFYENGCVSHAAMPMEPVARVGCVLHAPRLVEPRQEAYPTELVDIVPTVLALAGWPEQPAHQGRNVFATDRPPLDQRLVYFHVENPLVHADAVLLAGRWKYIYNRINGRRGLFDIVNDPQEARNVVELAEHQELVGLLSGILSRWRARQLAYYFYPAYYERYHPPRPPMLQVKLPQGDS